MEVIMTYIEFIRDYIKGKKVGDPIYTGAIAYLLAENFNLDEKKARAATSVAIKRLIEGKQVENLRCYQKGIYYLCNQTPFGETGINVNQLIVDKYIDGDNGFETGLGFLNRIGLTTQMTKQIVISTNEAKYCQREDKRLGVKTVPPRTRITEKNKLYLQFLDGLELIGKAPIDAEDTYERLAKYIADKKLDYGRLLGIASKYYTQTTLLQLAKTAEMEGVY